MTRYARGHKALYTLEINGEHASLRWDLHDLNRLEFFEYADDPAVRGWRSIHVSEGEMANLCGTTPASGSDEFSVRRALRKRIPDSARSVRSFA